MYKSRAIILSITKIRDNNTRIVFLSREYGKITGWWNKKNISGIDLWDIVDILISRENTRNLIKNIDIKTPWWDRNWKYNQILWFLETLHMINRISREGDECRSLYEDVSNFILYGLHRPLATSQFIIFQMRILKSIGSMNPEIFATDHILQYIYDNISHTPLERILSSSNIKNEHINTIQQINHQSLYILDR